jgi:hypothetical protein
MATVTIDAQALADADAFLTAFLVEKIPDADFSQGSVIRDFVVTAVAYIFAYLEQERKATRDQQSLLALSTKTDDESIQDAVNALLSNWFINRKTGQTARLSATLHFSSASDVTLAPTTRFFRTTDLVYVPDTTTGYVIPASSLTPTFNTNNVVIEYTVNINLVAQKVGTSYNVPSGKFIGADLFNPFFTFAENQSAIQGGKDIESTADLLLRAPTAISVRNLVNARSIDTVLREGFAGISRVLPIGFGDPEMLRDFSSESVTRLRMHVGGFTDIYVQLPVSEVVETGPLGGVYTRPDNVIAVFNDTSANFLASPAVAKGDILRVVSGLPDSPREYIINSDPTSTGFTVSTRAAFSDATDEHTPPAYVVYTIGNTAPNYSDKRVFALDGFGSPIPTGQTSRTIKNPARITLKGRPHYRVKRVELYEASTPTFIEVLTARVNGVPPPGEYRVISDTPANAQTTYALDQIEVSLTGHTTGTWIVRVTYDTLVGFTDVQAYVVDPFQRILVSNPLVKGYTPVYVSMSIAYRNRIGATTAVDPIAVAQTVATFINTFNLTNTLDLTGILQHMRDAYPDIGVVISPTILTYQLFAPDGQVYAYTTKDIVTVYPSYPENGANLTNGTALRTAITNADIDPTLGSNATPFAVANKALKDQLTELGISDRTLIYLTTASDITLTLVT